MKRSGIFLPDFPSLAEWVKRSGAAVDMKGQHCAFAVHQSLSDHATILASVYDGGVNVIGATKASFALVRDSAEETVFQGEKITVLREEKSDVQWRHALETACRELGVSPSLLAELVRSAASTRNAKKPKTPADTTPSVPPSS